MSVPRIPLVAMDDPLMKQMNELVMERRSDANLTSGAAFVAEAAAQEGAQLRRRPRL